MLASNPPPNSRPAWAADGAQSGSEAAHDATSMQETTPHLVAPTSLADTNCACTTAGIVVVVANQFGRAIHVAGL